MYLFCLSSEDLGWLTELRRSEALNKLWAISVKTPFVCTLLSTVEIPLFLEEYIENNSNLIHNSCRWGKREKEQEQIHV